MDLKESCNYGVVTIEDCLEMYEKKDYTTTINDGKVIKFERGEE